MGLAAIPKDIFARYQFQEWNHAAAILKAISARNGTTCWLPGEFYLKKMRS